MDDEHREPGGEPERGEDPGGPETEAAPGDSVPETAPGPAETAPEPSAPEVHRWTVGDLGIPPTPRPSPSPELGPSEWYTDRYRRAAGGGDRGLALRLRIPDDIAGWITLMGLLLALAALFLPWVGSEGFLIGAPGAVPAGYLDSWGLAAATNWLPGAVALISLALLLWTRRERVRHGIVPLSVGVFGLGNAWPYVGYVSLGWVALGVWVMMAGCLLAVAGGALRLALPGGDGASEQAPTAPSTTGQDAAPPS